MSSIYQNIRGALSVHLSAVAGIPAIAWEGVPYTPVVGTPFCTATLVPSGPELASLGSAPFYRHFGSFEVSLVYPSGQGTGTIEAMADLIRTAFTIETILSQGAQTIRTNKSTRGTIIQEPDWLRLPISIGWYTYDTTL